MATAALRFKLVFFVPASALGACKTAIFAAGAGRFPGYSECAFTTFGKGQFRPSDAANPHIGQAGILEEVEEARVEAICGSEDIARRAVEALKSAHPYEEPAYEVYRMEEL